MAGPSWVAGILAAVMVLAVAYSASRLAVSRLHGLITEVDTDGLHVLMGTAMAGMLVPQLSLLPGRTWAVVFGTGAAWFGAGALRSPSLGTFSWRCRYPVPHLVECIAMVYMLVSVPAAVRGAAMAMPGMGLSPAAPASFPALALVLALFMLGYLLWTTDQLTSLARATPTPDVPAGIADHRALVTVPAGRGPASMASTAGAPQARRTPGQPAPGQPTRDQQPAGQVQLAPKLALSKIAMSITMGYMLLLML